MNTHFVRANEGYESKAMSELQAHRYASTLRRLGNYEVAVWEVDNANTQNKR